jgi:transposase InsO family protein
LVRRKYRWLFSSTSCPKKPGPKGPEEALITAIVQLKSRNPRFGCPRIAHIISQTFGIDIDKNGVYRVLATHYRPAPRGTGPSWLSFIGHTKDSLWSVDLFRCESIVLRSYWVLVVLDQFTRRLVGIGVQCGTVTGADVCRLFNAAIHGQGVPRRVLRQNWIRQKISRNLRQSTLQSHGNRTPDLRQKLSGVDFT